ncbi:MAG: 50S ribosomal protein L18 [Spirochaetae bacterium HGW-Spirochaetae-1]|jgi:large subunit ribosomal protein L18|nr:MAG: 50S ribosomal protein L18 [Spirochaetae bacterium HGW-Spirochaetae-1]
MDKLTANKKTVIRRKFRIKKKIRAHKGKLRLCISRSNKNFYAQIIDDEQSKTLLGLSTLAPEFKSQKNTGNKEAAKALGKAIAEKAVALGIKNVVFDRNGNLYHGKIKAFADAARENGLEF